MLNNSSLSNKTAGLADPQTWNYMKIIRTAFCVSQLLLNTSMLIVFFVRRSLRTSFTVYIMCLLFSNIVYAGAEHPFEILFQSFKTSWMAPGLCTFYLYLFWVWCGVPMHIHMLITVNRIWAIALPHTYRKYHNLKMAYLLCGLSTVYVHIIALPAVLVDRLEYGVDVKEKGCTLNFDIGMINDYTTGIQIVVFDVPVVVIVLAYPFLLWKRMKRRKRNWIQDSSVTRANRIKPTAIDARRHKVTEERDSKSTDSARPFLILTFLTSSIFFLWTPTMTYWTVVCFIVPSWDTYTVPVRNVVSAMFAFQPALDPVIFALSLQSFRSAVGRIFSHGSGCRTAVSPETDGSVRIRVMHHV